MPCVALTPVGTGGRAVLAIPVPLMLMVILLEAVVGTSKLWLNDPAAVGTNWMVNMHEAPDGKLLAEHISFTMENGAGSTGTVLMLMPRFPALVNVTSQSQADPTDLSPNGV